jgi:hypothetical protein
LAAVEVLASRPAKQHLWGDRAVVVRIQQIHQALPGLQGRDLPVAMVGQRPHGMEQVGAVEAEQ